jgi:hypothetical protein
MDTKRSHAIVGLFSPEGVPSEEHLAELRKAPKIKKGEEDKLFQLNAGAFNNFKAWSKDHLAYIEQMNVITRQKVFLQRLLGVPEDAMPSDDPVPAQVDKKEATTPGASATKEKAPDLSDLSVDGEDDKAKVPKPKPAKPHSPPKPIPTKELDSPPAVTKPEPDDRQVALSHLFDKSSKSHLKKDVVDIGIRFRPEPGDTLVLPHETVEQMRLFTKDREGYIGAINGKTRPDLSEPHIEYLKLLLGLLLVVDVRQVALYCLFERSSVHPLKHHIEAIGNRFQPEKNDSLVLSPHVIEQMRLFTENRTGYIESISKKTRPDLSEYHIEHLKLLLSTLQMPNDRQIALSCLFDKSSTSHLKRHAEAIGARFRPEPGDTLVLPQETVEQMRLFAEDREGYIEAINSRTRPDLSESHIEYLRLLLGLLMDTGQKPETDPMDGPPLEPTPILEVKFKPKVSPPEWARKVMSNPYWDTARTRIELAFENMKSSDLAVRMDGMESLDRWQQRMREHKEGSSGKELVLFGDYMLTVIRVLRMGANPKSPEYKHMYSNS